MPLYDYECPNCSYMEEKQHSIKEDPEYKCPQCEQVMKKMISSGVGCCGLVSGGGTNVQRERESLHEEIRRERHNVRQGKGTWL